MSSQALSLDVRVIKRTLVQNARTSFTEWRQSVNTVASNLAPGLDTYGALCLVTTTEQWNKLRKNLVTAAIPAQPGSPAILEILPIAPIPNNPLGTVGVQSVAEVLPTAPVAAVYRPITDWAQPAPLGLGAGVTHTARDAFKASSEKHVVFCQAQSTLTAALLLSIGDELTQKIADPEIGILI